MTLETTACASSQAMASCPTVWPRDSAHGLRASYHVQHLVVELPIQATVVLGHPGPA